MSATPDQIGPYTIDRELGRGGMGVVYLGHDTRLDRKVAIKALPEHLAQEPERLARFEREAKTLASLNHPNIAQIYGVEEHEGRRYLVLEFVDGETLADRLDRGPLPVDEAIEMCAQVAEGLEAAHDAGVVHRDLKPANIRITPDGRAKVLDFGLARSDAQSGSDSSVSQAPTMTTPASPGSPTVPGAILGTAPYMSPEQARGRRVDKRSDSWSFGVVLYECLTGLCPFAGETISDSIGAILHRDVDLSLLPRDTPPGVRRTLERCLRRDRDERWRDIGDARLEMFATTAPGAEVIDPAGALTPMRVALLVAAALALGAATTVVVQQSIPTHDAPSPVERFEIPVRSAMQSRLTAPTIAPDGTAVAFIIDGRLWIRRMDSFEVTPVDGGDGAVICAWSPDSSEIAFAKGAEFWRVDAAGRRPRLIGTAPDVIGSGAGVAWLPGGRILFTTFNSGVLEMPAAGGQWREFYRPGAGVTDIHEIAWVPGSDALLVTVHRATGSWRLGVVRGGELRILEDLGAAAHNVLHPAYAPSGHVVYRQDGPNGGIWAAPFSIDALDVTGPPFKIASDGESPTTDSSGALVYARGGSNRHMLSWFDPETGELTPFSDRGDESMEDPSFSHDGAQVAYARTDMPGRDIWLEDLESRSRVRVTVTDSENWYPCISPDGSRIAAVEQVVDPPGWRLRFFAADGSGSIGESTETYDTISFDREWTTAVFDRESESTGVDVWAWDLAAGSEPRPVITDPDNQAQPSISPDGRWLVYTERSGSTSRIILTRFPDTTARWQISDSFGALPRWTPDGTGIMYIGIDEALQIVDLSLDGAVRIGRPRELISAEAGGVQSYLGYAMHPIDGRLLVPRLPVEQIGSQSIAVVRNWASEFSP
jgi:hypothetical protein